MSPNHNARQNNRTGRNSNKQNNRGRNQNGRGGRKGPSRQQSQQPLTATRQVDSHGPAGKLRGNVKQLYDQYKALAHENRTNDRVMSEAHSQHAHHYYSLYSEFAATEAAAEVEREKERARKKQEAAENQSNIVPIVEEDEKANGKDPVLLDNGGEGENKPVKKSRQKTNVKKKPIEQKPDSEEVKQESLELKLEEKVQSKPAPRKSKTAVTEPSE